MPAIDQFRIKSSGEVRNFGRVITKEAFETENDA